MRKTSMKAATIAALVAVCVPVVASADLIPFYRTGSATGYFTPFTSTTPAGTKFGDSGWFGSGSSAPATVGSVVLGLAVATNGTDPIPAGTVDIAFTFNNGDPSGFVFGNGATLYSTTITSVALPEISAPADEAFAFFDLVVPIPGGVSTLGGFNNVGFSVGVQNFNYTGSFGFQNRGDFNAVGFYTNNASQFTPGSGWSLFAFGGRNPQDIGNFAFTVNPIPEPSAALVPMAAGALLMGRRRRLA